MRATFRRPRSGSVPAAIGFAIVGSMALAAAFAPLLAPYNPVDPDLGSRLLAPGSAGHLLGTDSLGRDVLSRLIYGARIPLVMGVLAVAVGTVGGCAIGLVSGFRGGWFDRIAMRLADMQFSLPAMLMALTIVAVSGPSVAWLIVVLALGIWPTTARVVRAEVLSLRERDYVKAATTMGASGTYVVTRHLLRQVTGPTVVVATLELGQAILLIAGLSFLGLGVQPPTADWGAMLAEGRDYLASAWWIATLPGVALMILVIGINLICDWLRDRLDPRSELTREVQMAETN